MSLSVILETEQRRHLRAAIYATQNLIAMTPLPLKARWQKHERELWAALEKLNAKLEP
jgi:hypothetical protein